MTGTLNKVSPHINRYHDEDSLLIQFILSEYLIVGCILKKIEKNLEKLQIQPTTRTINSLRHQLIEISGRNHLNPRLVQWSTDQTLLSKLRDYCQYLTCNNSDCEEVVYLYRAVNKTWLQCLKSVDIIESAMFKEEEDIADLILSLEKTLHSFYRITKMLTNVITLYSRDENILFFVLRHHFEFEQIISNNYTATLFKNLFGDHESAAKFLIRQYRKRGFDNILPVIELKMKEL